MSRTYRIYLAKDGNSYRVIKAAKNPFRDIIGYVDTLSGIQAKVAEYGVLSVTYYFCI